MQNNETIEKDYQDPLGQPADEGDEDTPLTPEEEAVKTKSAAKELFEWVELFAYSVAIVIVLFTFLCRIAVVSGPSMEKTLYNGEVLLVSDLFYEPKQGDIIVFQSNTILDNEAIVKRVIATEGQVVDIDFENWIVYVDGEALEEPYITSDPGRYMNGSDYSFPMTVEEGKIFVMGDNRNGSRDSRHAELGTVDEDYLLGKAVFTFFPFSRIGFI